MARRSLLFSKKRSSKAAIGKKRKADEEQQQPCSTKRVRNVRLPDEEEEIGDFIVVDTGTLFEPEHSRQHFTLDEENDSIPTPRTPETPLPSIEVIDEEGEVVVKATPEILSPDSVEAHQARELLLRLPSTPSEASEDSRCRERSLDRLEDHIPSGSKHDPIVLSPLLTIDEKSPRSPVVEPPSKEIDSSISTPLETVFGHDAQVSCVSEDTQTDYQSLNLSPAPQEYSPLDVPVIQPACPSTFGMTAPNNAQHNERLPIKISAPERFGDAPRGVLVTKGDQCPSKFVVSGITSDAEADQRVSNLSDGQARSGITWFETVTESRPDNSLELSASESFRPAEVGTTIEGGLGISTVLQPASEPTCRDSSKTIGAMDPPSQPSLSEEPERPIQSSRTCEIVLRGGPEATQGILPEQAATDQKASFSEDEIVARILPLPSQYPTTSPEITSFSGWNLLNSAIKKGADDLETKFSRPANDVSSGVSFQLTSDSNPKALESSTRSSPPTLRFTSDNRAESALTTAEVQQLIQTFVRDAFAILPKGKTYPAGIILWQSLQKFHRWHNKEEELKAESKPRSSAITTMKFKLLDVHWRPDNVFYLPRKATGDEFRDLKQCIWDLFWVSSNLRGAENPKQFRILITRAPDMVDSAKLGHLTTASSPTYTELPSPFCGQPSSHSTFGNMAKDVQELDPSNTHHYHRVPGSRPPSLTGDSSQVTLEVEGAKTPQFLRDFLQKNRHYSDTSQPPPMQSLPTSQESNSKSAVQTELLHPPLVRAECNMTAAFQPRPSSRTSITSGPANNLPPRPNLPPPRSFGDAKPASSGSQPESLSFQDARFTRTAQVPSPHPSPVMADTWQTEILPPQLAVADSSYAANTARPMFSAQPQKDSIAPPTVLPSAQHIRTHNTAQPAPNVLIAPRPIQDKGKEAQTETSPATSQTSRTPREQKRFRDKAMQMISGRNNIELDAEETTGGRKRTYPEITGVIIDKNSEMGLVVITERGYTVSQVNTGQDAYFDQYTELTLREGQACVIHGSSTVLYYKQRSRALQQNRQSPPRKPLPSQAPQTIRNQLHDPSSAPAPPRQAVPTSEESQREKVDLQPSTTEIKIRVQRDGHGRFTGPHEFEVFTLTVNLQGFFWWFSKRTGRGGELGPERLRIVLKDAMPAAKTFDVYRGHFEAGFEEKFRRMKENILVECERTKAFMPELKEFSVLVVDPTWKGELD